MAEQEGQAEGAEIPPTEEGEAEGPAEPSPDDEPTQPHDLRRIAAQESKKRRRETLAELTIKRSKTREFTLRLDQEVTTIGRDPRCDIVLEDPDVSRKHAKIKRTGAGHFEVVDMGSKNGTRVNGVVVPRMTLLDGDTFGVGKTRFVLKLSAAAA